MTVVHRWLTEPLAKDVSLALERLARAPGVRRIAVMPDVHLAEHVCVGTVVATEGLVYPQAVGGDIGCGMATLRLRGGGAEEMSAESAERLLRAWRSVVPVVRQAKAQSVPDLGLSSDDFARRVLRDVRVQFGTVGRGNHFVELQEDEGGELWLLVHSGSRALGPAIREQHMRGAPPGKHGLCGLAAGGDAERYLVDHQAAQEFAIANRRAIAMAAAAAVHDVLGLEADWATWFDVVHNFVREENHDGHRLWVHRKGACSARDGEPGIIPGSMGASTYHVQGRGDAASMSSSSHGAGRCMARGEAMRRISARQMERDLEGVFYEARFADRLRDEAPSAYKDISKVMRAQKDLVRIVRRLRPVLVYKGV